MSLFTAVEMAPRDPILGLNEQFGADTNPAKVNLGVGVYYDEEGRIPLLASVKTAEEARVRQAKPRGYQPIEGPAAYTGAVQRLLFGTDSPLLAEGRVVTAQGLGGTGALRIGGDLLRRIVPEDAAHVRHSAAVSLRTLVPWQCEYRVFMPDGSVRWHITNAVPHREADGAVVCHGFTMDITDRKRAEREIERLAFYDALTGLPNRRMLLDRLQRAVAASARSLQLGALLFIDLDNFKDLNDTLGHDMGDHLLSQVAARLLSCVREVDTVARFGGDEFVVMLETLHTDLPDAASQAEIVAEKLLASLNLPFDLGGQQHYSTPSIGITLFGDQRLSVDELLKRADLAMYQAKAAGRNTQRFFDPDMQAAVNARSNLEADLRQGLVRGELCVHYQPVVDHHARLVGVEALVR